MDWQPIWYHQNVNFASLPVKTKELTETIQINCNLSGDKIRIVLTNQFGQETLIFEKIEVALDPMFHMKQQLTFQETKIFKIPVGRQIISDDCHIKVTSGCKLFFRLTTRRPQQYCDFLSTYDSSLTNAAFIRRYDWYPKLSQTFTARHGWFCLREVDLWTMALPKVIEFTGDSLAEMGLISASLDYLLQARYPGHYLVLNSGIAGNRFLQNAPQDEAIFQTFGEALITRLPNRLKKVKPKCVICFAGINDLLLPLISSAAQQTQFDAKKFIEWVTRFEHDLRQAGSQLIFSDLLPFKLSHGQTTHPADQRAQQQRILLNRQLDQYNWTFQASKTAIAQQQHFVPDYDLGDHLHVNKAGGQLLARELFKRIVTDC